MARWTILVAVLSGLTGACAHLPAAPTVQLRVTCSVSDAEVWLDDQLVGTVGDLSGRGRPIPPGFHRLEVRHPAYYSFFQELDLPAGQTTVIDARLHELVE